MVEHTVVNRKVAGSVPAITARLEVSSNGRTPGSQPDNRSSILRTSTSRRRLTEWQPAFTRTKLGVQLLSTGLKENACTKNTRFI